MYFCGMDKKRIIAAVFAVLAFCFWAFMRPEWLSYHEQYQMFLFSFDYLKEHLLLPGGFAVWTAEFLVQFFYNTFSGAAVVAGVLTGIFLLLKNNENQFAALLPSVLIWVYSGDESMMFTFPVAVLLSLAATKINTDKIPWIQFLIIPLIYWLIGYCVWIYVLLRARNVFKILTLVFFQFFVAYVTTRNYPLIDIFCGIDYYRVRMEIPVWQHLTAVSCVLAAFVKIPEKKWLFYTQCAAILSVLVFGVIKKYDNLRYDYIKVDYFSRFGKWESLLKFAEKNNLKSDFASTGINLALAMTNQMPDRVFEFCQSGNNGLISQFDYTCFSCGPTAEACYYLGLNNSVLRYNFDMQSGILNCKNSGRFFKRIAGAYILNRRYDVAQRYLNKLKKTLFYRSWALQAEDCLYDEEKIRQNPEWAGILSQRFENGLNFSNSDLDKMLICLFENRPINRMALNYALCSTLINRNLGAFVKYFPLYTKHFGTAEIPEIYQQAFLYACFQVGYAFENMPKFISEKVKDDFREFDRAYLINPKSKVFTTGKFSKSFWKYCLIDTRQ